MNAGDTTATPVDPMQVWPGVLTTLINGIDLDRETAQWAMSEVMSGRADAVPLAGFLVALRAKGETVDELSGFAASMLEHAVPLEVPGRCVDIVGTGGDRAQTVNISTMAALVVAGTGLTVVKHGNRAASSKSGSADVLEQLGVRLDLPVKDVAANAIEVGITFCFAQVFHPSMRHAAQARAGLGVATAFNFLGPLTNPAQPGATAVGVADLRLAPLIAGVFADRGTNALVFRGEEGLDELAQTSVSQVWEVRDGEVTHQRLDAVAELDVPPASLTDLRGQDAAFNANVARQVLDGVRGPIRDAVTLNAAATLVADGSLIGSGTLIERMKAGIVLAEKAIDSGRSANVLKRWVEASR